MRESGREVGREGESCGGRDEWTDEGREGRRLGWEGGRGGEGGRGEGDKCSFNDSPQ